MNRVKAIATRLLATQNQVNPSISYSSSSLLRFHQKLYFSSLKPDSILELVYKNRWSEKLENELENQYRPSLTHETVVYVLKRLDHNPHKVFSFFNWISEKQWFMPSSSLYSLVLSVLAKNNAPMKQQIWITLKTMKEKGFYLDEETHLAISSWFEKDKKMISDVVALSHFYSEMLQGNTMQSVVTKVVGIILGFDWDDDKVENELANVKIQLSDDFVIRVFEGLRGCPLKAYKFFHWVGKQSGYQHNTVTYNYVARVLATMDSIEEFWSIIKEMKSVDHELDLDTYIKISRQLQENRMMEDAARLYEHMMDSSYKPSVLDCIMLLKSIAESDEPGLDLFFRVAKKFESTGYTLSKEVYDGILKSLTSAGKFDEAQIIVKIMINAGYKPHKLTYSEIASGLCKLRRFEEASKVIDEMRACGCFPSRGEAMMDDYEVIKTWKILIKGYCDAGELDKALLTLAKMIEQNVAGVDDGLFEVLVDALLIQGRIDGAYKLILEDGIHISKATTFKKLIESLLGVGKFEEALDLLRLRWSSLKSFVSYISKFGTMEDAAKFLKVLSQNNYPSHKVYLQIFESLFQEGRLSDAKDLLNKCPHHIRKHSEIRGFFGSAESLKAQTQMTAT